MLTLDKVFNTKFFNSVILLGILIASFFLRYNRLDFQSLWLDELHTAATCGPSISFERFWFIYTHDNHPPLFYFFEWVWLNIFGLGDKLVRMPALIFGVLGVYAMYVAGSKFMNKTVGLLAAALLAVNAYHIEYSQEARQYTLLFATSTFSFTYLYVLLYQDAEQLKRYAIFYIISTTCMLYTHYFGIYLLATQGIIVLLVLYSKGLNIKSLLWLDPYKRVSVSALISILLFSPMIPILIRLNSYRMGGERPSTFVPAEYIYDFFGQNQFLLGLLLMSFLILIGKDYFSKNSSIVLFILFWLCISMFIPYVKSMISSPTVHIRYFSGSYPVLILIIGLAVYNIKDHAVKTLMIIAVISLSVINTFHEKRVYFNQTKCDWRSVGKFMAENNPKSYPIRDISPDINLIEMDFRGIYSYYPSFYGKKPVMMKDKAFFDSDIKGIWIFDSWWMPGHEEIENQLKERGFSVKLDQSSFGSRVMLWEHS